jgi:hypothetical protein
VDGLFPSRRRGIKGGHRYLASGLERKAVRMGAINAFALNIFGFSVVQHFSILTLYSPFLQNGKLGLKDGYRHQLSREGQMPISKRIKQ